MSTPDIYVHDEKPETSSEKEVIILVSEWVHHLCHFLELAVSIQSKGTMEAFEMNRSAHHQLCIVLVLSFGALSRKPINYVQFYPCVISHEAHGLLIIIKKSPPHRTHHLAPLLTPLRTPHRP